MWQPYLAGPPAGLLIGAGRDPARPALLCLHGAGGRGEAFRPQLYHLGGVANPAALDLPGHGATPGPGRETIAAYAAWVAAFLAAGPLRPVLLGHSMGGAVALAVALAHPELVAGLVLVATGARLPVAPAILEGLERDFPATVRRIVTLAHAQGSNPQLIDLGSELMAAPGPAVVRGDFLACARHDLRAGLGRLALPVLVIHGAQDRLASPSLGEELAGVLRDARLVMLAGASHMLHLERPGEVNRAVAVFLASLAGAKGPA